MARNWDTAGRGGLGSLVDAYQAGQDRSRNIAKEKADSQNQGSQWAFTNTKGYQKPKLDSHGFVSGYESDQGNRDRDAPIYKKMKPEYFRDEPAPAPAAPTPAAPPAAAPSAAPAPTQDFTQKPNQELSPSGRPMGQTYDDNGQPASPNSSGDPEPLLKDPKLAQNQQQMQGRLEEKKLAGGGKAIVGEGTQAVQYDPNDPGVATGQKNAQGADIRVRNATKTIMKPMEGANITGNVLPAASQASGAAAQPAAPAAPAPINQNQYDPSDWLMGRIGELATTPAARSTDQMISVGSLPPELLKGTGLEGFKGQIPVSVFREILQGNYKLQDSLNKKKPTQEYDTAVLGPLADDIRRKGKPLGEALEDFSIISGRPPSEREENILKTVSQAYESAGRANTLSKPPPGGYRFKDDGSLEKIPGGPASDKEAVAQNKKEKSKAIAQKTANIVVEDIDRAMNSMKANRSAVGPWVGQGKYVPGTQAYNLNNLLDSIRSNITIDKLQAMREASPTGGALGQVSDFENKMLQSAMGKIDVAMDPKDFAYNLRRLKDLYTDVVHGPGGSGAGGIAQGKGDDLSSKAATAMQMIDSSAATASEKRIAKEKVAKKYEELSGEKWKGAASGK